MIVLLLLVLLDLFHYAICKCINIIVFPKEFYKLHVWAHQVPAQDFH